MEEFFKAICDFILEIVESILENVIDAQHWDIKYFKLGVYVIFVPIVLIYTIAIGIVLYNKLKEKIKSWHKKT